MLTIGQSTNRICNWIASLLSWFVIVGHNDSWGSWDRTQHDSLSYIRLNHMSYFANNHLAQPFKHGRSTTQQGIPICSLWKCPYMPKWISCEQLAYTVSQNAKSINSHMDPSNSFLAFAAVCCVCILASFSEFNWASERGRICENSFHSDGENQCVNH